MACSAMKATSTATDMDRMTKSAPPFTLVWFMMNTATRAEKSTSTPSFQVPLPFDGPLRDDEDPLEPDDAGETDAADAVTEE